MGRTRRMPLSTDEAGRVDLKCFTRDELVAFVVEHGGTEGQATRLFQAIWQKGIRNLTEAPYVSRQLTKRLEEVAYLSVLEPVVVLSSDDGTKKFLWKLEDGRSIESVLIPDGDRLTLCMSSQVGCGMACTFCLTGDMGLVRHLKPSEIASQPLQVGRLLPEGTRITNLVLMGMGEPLHNLPNLLPALEITLDDHALNFSHRKITVSTVGLVNKLRELADELPVNLAVSLNASTDEQRSETMPVNKRWDIAELLQACREIPLPAGKRISFEYVMQGGFNDSLEDAQRLLDLLDDVPAKVNLIPYNENPDRDIKRPSDEAVKAFQHYMVSRGMHTTVRQSRGRDISAACGQLGKAWQQAMDRGILERARQDAGFAE